MNILRIPAGVYAVNCYLIFSENSNAGIIVDPGGDADELIRKIEENNVDLKYIVLTHGHGDHIGAVKDIKEKYKVDVLIHKEDADMIEDANKNLSINMAMGAIEIKADKTLRSGDSIQFGELEAQVIHTPGHTKGGICLKIENNLVSGDTLFKGSIGRCDLYGGDYATLINSIRQKLLKLPDDTIVYPGHGAESTIGSEKKNNQYLR